MMKKFLFYKYHGTGNDFVLIDNRDKSFNIRDHQLVESVCHRRFGVGADGLMLLEESDHALFFMRYYNSDGKEASMCGNGGRCIAAFAADLGIAPREEYFSFLAVDGIHEAFVGRDNEVKLKMTNVSNIKKEMGGWFLDTGSPHFVRMVDDPSVVDVVKEGRQWRNHERFAPAGTNVNFVGPLQDGKVVMRTYERGVEDETWSCGTGAVASAIATYVRNGRRGNSFLMKVPGGELKVHFESRRDGGFENIWLIGPAKYVFEGTWG